MGNIILPNNPAYKEGGTLAYTKSSTGRFYPVNLNLSRNSTRTRINGEGNIEEVPYNLILQSNNFGDSEWGKNGAGAASAPVIGTTNNENPFGVMNATEVTFDLNGGTSSGDFSQLTGATAFNAGDEVFIDTWLKSNDANSYVFSYVRPDATFETITVTPEWQRFNLTATITGGTSYRIRLRGNEGTSDSANILMFNAQGTRGSSKDDQIVTDRLDVPALDYSSGVQRWSVEPQRTNLLTYSNDFSNAAWSKAQSGTASVPVVTPNAGASPDGTNNASRIQFDLNGGTSGADISSLTQSVTSVNGTGSIYIKSNSGASQSIGLRLDTSTPTILNVTGSWQRFDLSNATASRLNLLLFGGLTDDTADILIYEAQLEEGAYATSTIPTQASQVTRSADVSSTTGLGGILNDSEGTLFFEGSWLDNSGFLFYRALVLSDGTNTNRVLLSSGNGDDLRASFIIGGTLQANILLDGALVPNENNKLAAAYQNNRFAFYLNGVKIGENNTITPYPNGTLTTLSQSNGDGSSRFVGNVRGLSYYDRALTDSELQELTK